jgi:hypothetical protein
MPPYCRNLLPIGLVCFLLVPNCIFASNDVSISKSVVDDDAAAAAASAAAAGGSSLHLVDEDKTYWGREIRKLYNQMMSMPPESKISVRKYMELYICIYIYIYLTFVSHYLLLCR